MSLSLDTSAGMRSCLAASWAMPRQSGAFHVVPLRASLSEQVTLRTRSRASVVAIVYKWTFELTVAMEVVLLH